MIIKSIKKQKHDIVVTFENEHVMHVAYDIYLKYHLEPSLAMDEKIFKEMQNENAFLFFKNMALKRLARMMTAYELYTYLLDKGASEAIAKQIIYDFKTKKYLDDDAYAKWYTEVKQLIEGPRLITEKLKQKGVSADIIHRYVDHIDESACLNASIAKKLKGGKHQNKHQLVMKLKRYYMQKGFRLDIVSECVKDAVNRLDIDEEALLKKELDHILRKTSGHIDKQKISERLYRKGYRYDDIKKAIEGIN